MFILHTREIKKLNSFSIEFLENVYAISLLLIQNCKEYNLLRYVFWSAILINDNVRYISYDFQGDLNWRNYLKLFVKRKRELYRLIGSTAYIPLLLAF
jgi:hypothetical protein